MRKITVKIGKPKPINANIEEPKDVEVALRDITLRQTSGTTNHDELTGRDLPNQHPMSSIEGLELALGEKQPIGNYALKKEIPSKTSELENDNGFITKAVNDLVNYYAKQETYSREEIDNKISSIPKFSIEVVDSLPTTDISETTVYLVSSGDEEDNLYTEYIYVNGVWEYLGKQTVDLTGYVQRTELSSYYTKTDMDALLETVRSSIPTKLSQLTGDASHRLVSDSEKQNWNNKQPAGDYVTETELDAKGYAKQTDVSQLQEEIADLKEENYVKTINGVAPDENGNVVVSGGTEVCPYEEVNSIEEMTDTSKKYLMNGYVYSYVATSGVEVPNFTNLADPTSSDWGTDKRLGSDSTFRDFAGAVVTNFIECKRGDVIRVKGISLTQKETAGNTTAPYIHLIHTNGSATNHDINSYEDDFVVSNGITTFTVMVGNGAQLSVSNGEVEKLRMSGLLTASDASGVIITKNEEIAYRVTDGTYEWVKGEKCDSSSGSTGGSTGGTTTDEYVVPDYWQDHLDSKIATVKALQDTVGDELVSFPNFTDLHCNANQSYNLGRNIGILSKEIMNRCNLPFAVCDGDTNSNGNLSTKDAVETCLENAMEIFTPIIDDLLLARGNHDITYGGSSTDGNAYQWQYSPSEVYNKLFRWQATDFRRVFDTDSDGTYFYVDDKAHKTRFIVLDSQWVEWQGRNDDGSVIYNGHHNSGYGQRQLEWLANKALQFDETGREAVIVTHVPPTSITYNGTTRDYLSETRDGVIFKEIVRAFCNKTTYEGTYTGTAEWQNVNIAVDFTSRKGNVACILSGHCHCDRIIEDELPCPIITTTSASDMARTGEETEDRVYGTITETAFDIVSIDRVNHKIYMTRVGIGSDRECSFSPEVLPYTLVPPTTVDFAEYEGAYESESTFMLDPSKSYKVIWDGVEYVVDKVFDMSDETTTMYAIGNPAALEQEDNGMPFVIGTINTDGGLVLSVLDWLYYSGQTDEPSNVTFSVAEIVEEDLPVYKCTLETELITDTNGNSEEIPVLKGISPNALRQKQRTIEIDGKLYTSTYVADGEQVEGYVYLTRIYASDMIYLRRETLYFSVSLGKVIHANTLTAYITMTNNQELD